MSRLRKTQPIEQPVEQPVDEDYVPTPEEIAQYYYEQGQLAEQQRRQQQETKVTPLSVVDEIKRRPSAKGTFPITIGGRAIDLHVLEDYILKTSPYALKTITRFNQARSILESKNFGQGSTRRGGMKLGTLLLIIGLIGVVLIGIMLLMFGPQISSMFKNMFPM